MVQDRTTSSPLLGPLEPASRGRVLLRVPSDAFDEEHHHLQLLSFRDEELRGPAASDVVAVPWRRRRRDDRWEDPMSTMAQSRSASPTAYAGAASSPPGRPSAVPARMSEAQFLDALAGVISRVLPIVRQALPVVEQIGRAISSPAQPPPAQPPSAQPPPATPAAAAGPATPSRPDLAQLLVQLLRQVQQASAGPAAPAAPAGAVAHSVPATGAERYSQAKVAPLLAALPALAPVLQSVLTPQTVQSLISAADPNRLLQTAVNGIMDAARIGQAATDALHAHLRALNPGLGDDVLVPLLASMSATASTHDGRRRPTMSRLVRLELPELVGVELGGYPQVCFRRGDEIRLPVSVDTARPVPRPSLRVYVKEAGTGRQVAERTWSFPRLEAGPVPEAVVLPTAVTGRLEPGREYHVVLALEWRGRSGLVGATTTQLVRIVGGALFDSLDSGGTPVRLDDVDRDRSWWHKVWADEVDDTSRRTKARLDYEFRLLPTATTNRRSRTAAELSQVTSRRQEGVLRAGLGVAPAELSRLAERLAGGPLDEETLDALATPEFAAAFDRRATSTLSLQGRPGGRVAVWVWPEVKLHGAFLKQPGKVSPETGQVLSFETRRVSVPVPCLAHVLTTRSD